MLGSASGQQGFTLLEVLVAVVILGLAYVAILQNLSLAFSNIFRLDKKREAILVEELDFAHGLRAGGQWTDESFSSDIFMEGHKCRLLKILSKNGELETVKLEKL